MRCRIYGEQPTSAWTRAAQAPLVKGQRGLHEWGVQAETGTSVSFVLSSLHAGDASLPKADELGGLHPSASLPRKPHAPVPRGAPADGDRASLWLSLEDIPQAEPALPGWGQPPGQ